MEQPINILFHVLRQCLPAHIFDELRSDFHVTSHRHASSFDANVSFVRAAFGAINDVAKIVPKVESFRHTVELTGAAGTVIRRPTTHHLWDVGMEMSFFEWCSFKIIHLINPLKWIS